VELSEAARDARNARHGIATPAAIIPMGTWLSRVPTASYAGKRVAFVGTLAPEKGIDVLLGALALIDVEADIVGGGSMEQHVRDSVTRLGLDARVRVHGFVPDHRDVERIVGAASVAVAPYDPAEESYARFADPGKLKTYLAAGLPVVLTAVPPNANELAREAGAEIVAFEPAALARGIEKALADAGEWQRRHDAALVYAARFDWERLLGDALPRLGIAIPATKPAT
jgi:glycosyltransferase involved in cell wall biosynthesis